MSIDAQVKTVHHNEDGSGWLELIDRPGKPPGIAGQKELHFRSSPHEDTALNGLNIWGSASVIMLGDKQIAHRRSYTTIEFVDRQQFLDAVTEYHRRPSDGRER